MVKPLALVTAEEIKLAPLRGNCLVSDIIYKATVKSIRGTATYVGLCSGEFKKRFYNHTKSFKNKKYQKETELSKYIWDLKTENSDYSINWEILKKSNTGKRKSGMCNLCMEEKLHIISLKNDHLLNKRNELVSKCRHGNNRKQNTAGSRVKEKP